MTTRTAVTAHLTRGPQPSVCAGHYRAWRAATAVPAMVASLLLLLVLFGWAGQWEGLVLLGWLAAGAALCTRVGERVAVAVGCRWRRPSTTQAALVAAAWAAALDRAAINRLDVDLYIQPSAEVNLYAVGRRSVAVTSRVLADLAAGRLDDDQLMAAIVHDLGHLATRATRHTLAATWLAAPWRVAARWVIGDRDGDCRIGVRPRAANALVRVIADGSLPGFGQDVRWCATGWPATTRGPFRGVNETDQC